MAGSKRRAAAVKRAVLVVALLGTWVAWSACKPPPHGDSGFPAKWRSTTGVRSVYLLMRTKGDDVGTIQTALGEQRFLGYYARIRPEGAPIISNIYEKWDALEYADNDWDSDGENFEPVEYDTFVRVYEGRVLATLKSEQGTHIRCNLEFNQPDLGVVAGVRGRCQVSDGGSIDVGG